MICDYCKYAVDNNNMTQHKHCPGGTWCDCQHREPNVQPKERQERVREITKADSKESGDDSRGTS